MLKEYLPVVMKERMKENGGYHGKGTFTFNDGAKYVEEFKDGIIWNGEVYNGNIKYKIVNGK